MGMQPEVLEKDLHAENPAVSFLAATDRLADCAFATALCSELHRVDGDAHIDAVEADSAIYPCACIISLYGVSACGADLHQAIRNWRRMAAWQTALHPLSDTDAQMLAWSAEALDSPKILDSAPLLTRACNHILRHAPLREDGLRAKATELLCAPPHTHTAATSPA